MNKIVALSVSLVLFTASLLTIPNPAVSSITVEDSWVSKAPLQEARGDLGVAAANGKIYAIGGSNGSSPDGLSIFVGTNEEYDPATNTWVFKKPMPTPRVYFCIAAFQNKIYCIGGYLSNGSITGVNEVYDTATDTWETKAAMSTPRVGLTANAANGRIYLIGGGTPPEHSNDTISPLSLNEAYDPETDTWTTMKPMPFGSGGASVVFGDRIYFFVGLYYNRTIDNIILIYDAVADSWSQGAKPPRYVANGEAVVTTGVNAFKRIYVLAEDFDSDGQPFRLHVYDPGLESWTEGAALPTWRREFGVAVVNDLVYAIGGSKTVYNGTVPFDWSSSYIVNYAANEQYTPFGYGTPDPSSSSSINTKTEPFPIELVAAVSTGLVVATAGLLIYFKKKHNDARATNAKMDD
jgi:N-acetylneuraminic acid mutarotase